MEVGVLGPLEVHHQGSPVALGARMERALLTILVLEVAHLRRALQPDR
jgi:DNA-binding SARP family transcriptional activator